MSIKERLFNFSLKALSPNNQNSFSNGSYGYKWYNYLLGDKSLKNVMERGFEANTHVFSIINRIAQTGAGLPIVIYDINAKGEKEVISEGDFYNFIHNPNDDNNYKTFTYESLVYQLATGNEVIYGEPLAGMELIKKVYNKAPQYITPQWKVDKTRGVTPTKYQYNIGGQEYHYEPEEIMHLRKFNPDPNSRNPVMGLSPLQAGFATLSASNDILLADASIIKNRGMSGMLTNRGGKADGTEIKAELDKILKKRIGGAEKMNSIGATNANIDFIQFAMSPADLRILESGLVKKRDLCDIFNCDSSVFNDPESKKNNNRKEGQKEFILTAVLPPVKSHLDLFSKTYIPAWNERDKKNYFVEVDEERIEVLQEDQAKKAVKQRTLSEAVRKVVEGVALGNYTTESAIEQLVFAHEIDRDLAVQLVGQKPEKDEPIIS
jgi:HK97 family phage portal protein